MERLTIGQPVPAHLGGAVMALGNFDGFHAGHQVVADRARALAHAQGRPAMIATFDPHPVRVFKPSCTAFRLTSLDQRERLFAAAGFDAMLVFEFNETMALCLPNEFGHLLIEDIGVAAVVTGMDFSFGYRRSGNAATLRTLGLTAEEVAHVKDGQAVISSSRIRQMLKDGHCRDALRLLTRPFAVQAMLKPGTPLHGLPTAYFPMSDYILPAAGLYAVHAVLPDGNRLGGAANVRSAPCPADVVELLLFDGNSIFDEQEVEVHFLHRIHTHNRGLFDHSAVQDVHKWLISEQDFPIS